MRPIRGIKPIKGFANMGSPDPSQRMRTKQLLEITDISEPTLRRWLNEGRIPELMACTRDWRGWRIWEQRHIDAIRRYQRQKTGQYEAGEDDPDTQVALLSTHKRQRSR